MHVLGRAMSRRAMSRRAKLGPLTPSGGRRLVILVYLFGVGDASRDASAAIEHLEFANMSFR